MVAARGRFTALWFVSLMVSATFVGVSPTVSAQTVDSAVLRYAANNTVLPDNTVVHAGMELELATSSSGFGATCGATPTATLRSKDKLTANDVSATGTNVGGSFEIATAAFTVAANLVDSSTPQTLTVEVACGTQTVSKQTQPIIIENLLPSIQLVNLQWTNATDGTHVDLGDDEQPLGVGSTISFIARAGDGRGLRDIQVHAPSIDGSVGDVVANNTAVSLTVAPVTTGALTGQVANYVMVFANDTNGNQNVAVLNFGLDNGIPAPTTWTTNASRLTRAADGVALDLSVNDGGHGDTRNVAIFLKKGSAAEALHGAASIPAGGAAATSFTLADNYATPVHVNLSPVDRAGNVNTALRHAVVFPTANMSYGPSGDNPLIVAEKNFGNVYVQVSANGPTGEDGDEPKLFGQLIRDADLVAAGGSSADRPLYWVNGTAGSSVFATTGAHFTATSQVADTGNAGTTAFQPTGALALNTLYVLSNLSHASGRTRDFEDGRYTLEITVQNPGQNNNALALRRGFLIDNVGPTAGGSRAYSNQLGPNMTQVHGADGNPLQLHINVSDLRELNSATTFPRTESPQDSGLAYVHVEFIDVTTDDVARLANGLTGEAGLARVNLSPSNVMTKFPHFHDWADPPAVSTCPMDPEACVYQQFTLGRWGASFVNGSWISGWVNTTFPDLPTGNYSIRVTGYDEAGRATSTPRTAMTGTSNYVVAPLVRLELPRIREDGSLDVSVQASQRSLEPDAQACTGVTCPVESTIVWVANDINDPERYVERRIGRTPAAGGPLPGFNGSYEPLTNGNLSGALAFNTTAIPTMYYTYSSAAASEALQSFGIDIARDVFVRGEAVTVLEDGSKVTRFTDWVKAASANAAAVNISQPAYDWQFNLTTMQGHATPPFYVQYDRRGEATKPFLAYTITSVTNGTEYANVTGLTPDGADPRFVYNWSGVLKDRVRDATLYPGAYRFRATVYDTLAQPISFADRYFIVNSTRPSIYIPADQPGYGLIEGATEFVAGKNFELTFSVNHGHVDLVSLSNLTFTLERETATGSEGGLLEEGEEGFEVALRAETPLNTEAMNTTFTANVTLPTNRPSDNNAIFRLYITAALDREPWVVGNTTRFIDVRYDREAPEGRLSVNDTIATVYDLDDVNPHRNLVPVTPQFRGFAKDLGAGLDKVELRITDVTRNVTLNFTTSGGVEMIDPEDPDDLTEWISNRTNVVRTLALPDGEWLWWLPLTSRGFGFPDLYKAGDEADGSRYKFNLSHTYRVDVRLTDKLGQTADGESIVFDWDASAPDLAYGNFLAGAAAGQPSGIFATFDRTSATVPWHAEDDDTTFRVIATDNHCLADVRILGRSDASPDRIVSASMEPPGGSRICPNGGLVNYTLELEDAPELTGEVGMWTYWFSATDWANQTTEIPASFRTLRVNVIDVTPAVVRNVTIDPPVGQAGGRSLIRADVFDNVAVDRVEVRVVDPNSTTTVLASGFMRPVNASETVGMWILDTTEDLGLDLDVRDYRILVTAYDVNWNRSAANGGPTCDNLICNVYRGGIAYSVRDDGIPTVSLESPGANNATVNATPTIKLRALHKLLTTNVISVSVSTEGNASNMSAVPLAELVFEELESSNGTRQGYSVAYTPATPLTDNTTLLVNITASAGGVIAAQTFTFRVDAVGPTASANVTGTRVLGNKTFATSSTRVTLTANDSVSTTTILYRVGSGNPVTYNGPLTPSGTDATWSLEYWAVDSANNIGAKQTLTLALDLAGPVISVGQHGDSVLLFVNDTGSGVNESTVTVHFRYGPGTTFSTLVAQKVTSNSFSASLPGNASETGLSYYFTAQDNLGQVGSAFSAAVPYNIGEDNATPSNLPPTIRITSPTASASVGSLVDLKWLAEDPEGAPLSISIALRDPAPGRVLSAGGENSGTFRVNLTGLPAGAYTLVVTANDGENSASAQVSFNLEAGKAIQPQTVPPATVQPNTQVSIAVAIQPSGKTVAQATYRLLRDGEIATQGRLAPTQGLYAAGFTPTEAGDYTVFVDVVYTDGTTEPSTQVAAFSVPSDGGTGGAIARGVFPTSLMALVAIAILTVALAAYGAFGRWKK